MSNDNIIRLSQSHHHFNDEPWWNHCSNHHNHNRQQYHKERKSFSRFLEASTILSFLLILVQLPYATHSFTTTTITARRTCTILQRRIVGERQHPSFVIVNRHRSSFFDHGSSRIHARYTPHPQILKPTTYRHHAISSSSSSTTQNIEDEQTSSSSYNINNIDIDIKNTTTPIPPITNLTDLIITTLSHHGPITATNQLLHHLKNKNPTFSQPPPPPLSLYHTLLSTLLSTSTKPIPTTTCTLAHDLLRTHPTPDTLCYTHLMTIYASSITPSSPSSTLQRVRSLHRHVTVTSNLRRTTNVDNALLMAWSRSLPPPSHPDRSARRADAILTSMEENSIDNNIERRRRPTVESYNHVMTAWSKCAAAGSLPTTAILNHCDKLRARMNERGISKNVKSYNALMSVYASLSTVEAARLAEDLFRNMTLEGLVPDRATFRKLITLYSRPGTAMNATRAQEWLTSMEERASISSTEDDDDDDDGDPRPYTSVIAAWARSFDERKVERAEQVLNRMKEVLGEDRCDVAAYNSFLKVCAMPPSSQEGDAAMERKRVFGKAIRIYRELTSSLSDTRPEPNHVTYGLMLRCVARLLPSNEQKRKDEICDVLFRRCRRDGLVGDVVVKGLRRAASNDCFKRLMARDDDDGDDGEEWRRHDNDRGGGGGGGRRKREDDVPYEWRRNVVEGSGHVARGRGRKSRR